MAISYSCFFLIQGENGTSCPTGSGFRKDEWLIFECYGVGVIVPCHSITWLLVTTLKGLISELSLLSKQDGITEMNFIACSPPAEPNRMIFDSVSWQKFCQVQSAPTPKDSALFERTYPLEKANPLFPSIGNNFPFSVSSLKLTGVSFWHSRFSFA